MSCLILVNPRKINKISNKHTSSARHDTVHTPRNDCPASNTLSLACYLRNLISFVQGGLLEGQRPEGWLGWQLCVFFNEEVWFLDEHWENTDDFGIICMDLFGLFSEASDFLHLVICLILSSKVWLLHWFIIVFLSIAYYSYTSYTNVDLFKWILGLLPLVLALAPARAFFAPEESVDVLMEAAELGEGRGEGRVVEGLWCLGVESGLGSVFCFIIFPLGILTLQVNKVLFCCVFFV